MFFWALAVGVVVVLVLIAASLLLGMALAALQARVAGFRSPPKSDGDQG